MTGTAIRVMGALEVTMCEWIDFDRLVVHWFVQCNITVTTSGHVLAKKTGRHYPLATGPGRGRQKLHPARHYGFFCPEGPWEVRNCCSAAEVIIT
jgi:hypothetical protein